VSNEADEFAPGGMFESGPQNEDRTVRPAMVHHAFSNVHPVITGDAQNSFTLCRITGERAENGMCPIHDSDACLFLFVRFNWIMEIAEKEWKKARLAIRKHV